MPPGPALRHLDLERCERSRCDAVYRLRHDLGRCLEVKPRLAPLVREIRRSRYPEGCRLWALHFWLEGIVYQRSGRRKSALQRLARARKQLLAEGAGRDAALVSLDFAEAALESGNQARAHRLAEDVKSLLEALEPDPNTREAFRLWCSALADGGPALELGERVRRALLASAG